MICACNDSHWFKAQVKQGEFQKKNLWFVWVFFFKPSTFQSEALFNYAEKKKIHPGRFLGLQGAVRPQTENGPMYGYSQPNVSLSGSEEGEWALES